MSSYREECTRYHVQAANAGLSYGEAEQLRRDAQRLHSWSEHECNGVMERVEDADRVDHHGRQMIQGAVYFVYNINGRGPLRYSRTADRETPARERIEAIGAKVGTVEFQGDPRGWPVSIKLADGRTLSPPVRS